MHSQQEEMLSSVHEDNYTPDYTDEYNSSVNNSDELVCLEDLMYVSSTVSVTVENRIVYRMPALQILFDLPEYTELSYEIMNDTRYESGVLNGRTHCIYFECDPTDVYCMKATVEGYPTFVKMLSYDDADIDLLCDLPKKEIRRPGRPRKNNSVSASKKHALKSDVSKVDVPNTDASSDEADNKREKTLEVKKKALLKIQELKDKVLSDNVVKVKKSRAKKIDRLVEKTI